MIERTYTIVIDPEPDGSAYNVTVPALPGCATWGATVEETISMAKDAIAVYLEGENREELLGAEPGEAIVATVTV